jgi:hypothetical protein
MNFLFVKPKIAKKTKQLTLEEVEILELLKRRKWAT